jgi:hypothetical protein
VLPCVTTAFENNFVFSQDGAPAYMSNTITQQ